MESQALPAVRVLMVGRFEELDVEILEGLQQSGYRTECEQIAGLEALADHLHAKCWDVVICVPSENEDRGHAARLCEQIQPGLLFIVIENGEGTGHADPTRGRGGRLSAVELDWLSALIRKRTEVSLCSS